MFKYHILALFIGTVLEMFLKKQYCIWNPFDVIRAWIKYLDRALLGDDLILLEPSKQKCFGLWLVILVLFPVFAISLFFMLLAYEISPIVGVIIEAIASFYCFDASYTYYISREIAESYYADGVEAMREEAQLFTQSDLENADIEEINNSVITKVANEAGDSSISPMLIMFLFGPVAGFAYRTIDLLDSIVGHHTDRYEYFGYYTARLNRIIDFIPGRFSGLLCVFAARFSFGDFHWKNARYIDMRDRTKAISAFAGALELELKKGTVGDADKVTEVNDIKRAASLHRNMFIICQCILVILLVFF